MVGSPFCGDSLHCAIAYICFVFGVFGGGAIWPFVGALIVLLIRGFAPSGLSLEKTHLDESQKWSSYLKLPGRRVA